MTVTVSGIDWIGMAAFLLLAVVLSFRRTRG